MAAPVAHRPARLRAVGTAFAFAFALMSIAAAAGPAQARQRAAGKGRAAVSQRSNGARAASSQQRGGGRIAVQPISGASGQALRSYVTRLVRGRGFRPVTSIPHYEGTGQYPGLARDHRLAAFITADLTERGKWQSVTFLVWNGASGTVVGRWSTGAHADRFHQAVGRGFWKNLGPAVLRSHAPPPPLGTDRAAPMWIDASSTDDEPLAVR
jgi:hypothetical protein